MVKYINIPEEFDTLDNMIRSFIFVMVIKVSVINIMITRVMVT